MASRSAAGSEPAIGAAASIELFWASNPAVADPAAAARNFRRVMPSAPSPERLPSRVLDGLSICTFPLCRMINPGSLGSSFTGSTLPPVFGEAYEYWQFAENRNQHASRRADVVGLRLATASENASRDARPCEGRYAPLFLQAGGNGRRRHGLVHPAAPRFSADGHFREGRQEASRLKLRGVSIRGLPCRGSHHAGAGGSVNPSASRCFEVNFILSAAGSILIWRSEFQKGGRTFRSDNSQHSKRGL